MKLLNLIIPVALIMAASCSKPAPDHTGLVQDIRAANKMVFASMTITKTAKLESSKWYTIGKRIAVYSYDAYLHAYIDLSEFTPEDMVFDEKNHTVTITLPAVKVEAVGRDMKMRKEYENIGILRGDVDAKERAEIKEIANTSFNKEVAGNATFRKQLTEAAERKARSYFETLLAADGYTASINFKP